MYLNVTLFIVYFVSFLENEVTLLSILCVGELSPAHVQQAKGTKFAFVATNSVPQIFSPLFQRPSTFQFSFFTGSSSNVLRLEMGEIHFDVQAKNCDWLLSLIFLLLDQSISSKNVQSFSTVSYILLHFINFYHPALCGNR